MKDKSFESSGGLNGCCKLGAVTAALICLMAADALADSETTVISENGHTATFVVTQDCSSGDPDVELTSLTGYASGIPYRIIYEWDTSGDPDSHSTVFGPPTLPSNDPVELTDYTGSLTATLLAYPTYPPLINPATIFADEPLNMPCE